MSDSPLSGKAAADEEPVTHNSISSAAILLPSTRRWVDAVLAVVDHDSDTRTVAEWCRTAGKSASCIRSICVMQGVRPKPSLNFGRILRLVVRDEVDLIWQHLSVDDPRTVRRILKMAGIESPPAPVFTPTALQFIQSQRYILAPLCREAIATVMLERLNRAPLVRTLHR